jgi:hypothetical protein
MQYRLVLQCSGVNGPALPEGVQIGDDIEPQFVGEDTVIGRNSE